MVQHFPCCDPASPSLHCQAKEVVLAKVGHAFLHIKAADSAFIYPALWKDDMGHGSALAGHFSRLFCMFLVWVHDSQTDVSDWSGVLVAAVLALTLKLTQGDRLGRHLVYLLYAAALTSIRTCGRIYSPGCWKACCPLLGGQRVLGLQAPHCKKSFFANHLSVATIWTGRAEFGQKAWRDEGWGTFPLSLLPDL